MATDQTEIEFRVQSRYSNDKRMVAIHQRESATWKARLACALIERWGLVVGAPDGEDSAGRSKGRKMLPAELVAEATEVADLAIEEFRRRGWVIELPSLADIETAKIDKE